MRERIGAVPFVFGALGAQRLPGPILVTVLADLGVPPTASRTLLARMVRRGLLETERFGRVTRYRLAGHAADGFARIRDGAVAPEWDGGFATVIYDVPEDRRRRRDALLAAAAAGGFGSPRPGLLIGLSDPHEWVEAHHADGVLLETGRLVCDVPAARRLAERAWGLAAAADDLRAELARTEDALRQARVDPPQGPAALRLLFDAFRRGSVARLAVPALPAVLLPDDRPETRLHDATIDLARQLHPSTHAYVADVLATAPHAHLYVADPEAPRPGRW